MPEYDDGIGCGFGYGIGHGRGDGYGTGYAYDVDAREYYTVSHDTPIIAYHYVREDRRLHHLHRGKHTRVKVGTVLQVDGDPVLRRHGLHASLTPEDARRYASGVLTRVACSGRVIYGFDKLVCTRREVLEVIDA